MTRHAFYQRWMAKHPKVCSKCSRRFPPHREKCTDHTPPLKLWDQRSEQWWPTMVGDAPPLWETR